MGVYLVHLSVLIIFAGAMVGSIWGFAGRVNIAEGDTVNSIILERGREYPLNFSLRLDKSSVSFYPNSQRPSEYRSDITVLENGQEVDKAVLRVNHPLEYQGIDFYLSSYGELPQTATMFLKRKDQPTQKVELKYQQWNPLPGGGQAGLIDLKPEVNMGGMYQGPLARVAYQPEGGEPMSLAAFKGETKMPSRGPVTFELLDWQSTRYNSLQVKYDPGVWFVWVGCTLMVAAFFVAFYLAHRKVWISLNPAEKGRTRVEISGGTNKNRSGLTKLLASLENTCRGRIGAGERNHG
jgi:cytochrome c biogenesis protein